MPVALYQKNGGPPQVIPREDRDGDGMPWTDLANNPVGRVATGWTLAPEQPEYDPETEVVRWVDGAWVVEPAPPVEQTPVQITKSDFSRLFTMEQRFRLEKLEDDAKAANLGDPTQAAIYGPVRIMFRSFSLPAEFIELNHPETIGAVLGPLRSQGVIESDEEAERILRGEFPS